MRGLGNYYVLHARAYGDNGLLLELFSAAEGRFPALARGVKSRRSPARGLLQPFQPLLLGLTGRGEVRTLARVDSAGPPLPLRGAGLYCGLYVNELLLRLLGRNDPCEELFPKYERVLRAMGSEAERAPALRRFELGLLQILGYGLLLDRDALSGAPVRPECDYHYHLELGPVAAGEGPGEGVRVCGATLLGLAGTGPLDPPALREARDLMRGVLDHHLGYRPLKARELFRRALQRHA